LVALEVDRHVQLVAMQVLVVGTEPVGAGRLALRPAWYFDLDHLGAPVGELPRAGRTGAMQGQVEDGEVLKRQLCHCAFPFCTVSGMIGRTTLGEDSER